VGNYEAELSVSSTGLYLKFITAAFEYMT